MSLDDTSKNFVNVNHNESPIYGRNLAEHDISQKSEFVRKVSRSSDEDNNDSAHILGERRYKSRDKIIKSKNKRVTHKYENALSSRYEQNHPDKSVSEHFQLLSNRIEDLTKKLIISEKEKETLLQKQKQNIQDYERQPIPNSKTNDNISNHHLPSNDNAFINIDESKHPINTKEDVWIDIAVTSKPLYMHHQDNKSIEFNTPATTEDIWTESKTITTHTPLTVDHNSLLHNPLPNNLYPHYQQQQQQQQFPYSVRQQYSSSQLFDDIKENNKYNLQKEIHPNNKNLLIELEQSQIEIESLSSELLHSRNNIAKKDAELRVLQDRTSRDQGRLHHLEASLASLESVNIKLKAETDTMRRAAALLSADRDRYQNDLTNATQEIKRIQIELQDASYTSEKLRLEINRLKDDRDAAVTITSTPRSERKDNQKNNKSTTTYLDKNNNNNNDPTVFPMKTVPQDEGNTATTTLQNVAPLQEEIKYLTGQLQTKEELIRKISQSAIEAEGREAALRKLIATLDHDRTRQRSDQSDMKVSDDMWQHKPNHPKQNESPKQRIDGTTKAGGRYFDVSSSQESDHLGWSRKQSAKQLVHLPSNIGGDGVSPKMHIKSITSTHSDKLNAMEAISSVFISEILAAATTSTSNTSARLSKQTQGYDDDNIINNNQRHSSSNPNSNGANYRLNGTTAVNDTSSNSNKNFPLLTMSSSVLRTACVRGALRLLQDYTNDHNTDVTAAGNVVTVESILQIIQNKSNSLEDLEILQSQLQFLQSELIEKKNEENELTHQINSKRIDYDQLMANYNKYKSETEATYNELQSLSNCLKSGKEELLKLQNEKNVMQSHLTSLQDSVGTFEQNILFQSKLKQETTEIISKLKADENHWKQKAEIAKINADKKEAKLKLAKSLASEQLQLLQQETTKLQNEIHELRATAKNFENARLSEASEGKSQLQRQEDQLQLLRRQYEELQRRLNSSKETQRLIESDIQDLMARKTRLESETSVTVDEKSAMLSKLTIDILSSERRSEALLRQVDEYERKLRSNKEAVSVGEAELGVVRQSIDELRRQHVDLERTLEVKRRNMETELASMQEQSQEASRAARQVTVVSEQTRSDIEIKSAELRQVERRVDELKRLIREQENKLVVLKDTSNDLEADNSRMAIQLEVSRRDEEEMRIKTKGMKSTLESETRVLEDTRRRVKMLQEEIAEGREVEGRVRNSLQMLRKAVDDSQQELNDLRLSGDKERAMLLDLKAKTISSETEYHRLENSIQSYREQLQQDEKQRGEAQMMMTTAREEASRLHSEILQYNRQLDLLKRQEGEATRKEKESECNKNRVQNELVSLSRSLSEERKMLSLIRIERDNLTSQIDDSKLLLGQLQVEITDASKSLQESRALWSQSESQRQTAIQDFQRVCNRIKDEEARLSRLESKTVMTENKLKIILDEYKAAEQTTLHAKSIAQAEVVQLEEQRRGIQEALNTQQQLKDELHLTQEKLIKVKATALQEISELDFAKRDIQSELIRANTTSKKVEVCVERDTKQSSGFNNSSSYFNFTDDKRSPLSSSHNYYDHYRIRNNNSHIVADNRSPIKVSVNQKSPTADQYPLHKFETNDNMVSQSSKNFPRNEMEYKSIHQVTSNEFLGTLPRRTIEDEIRMLQEQSNAIISSSEK